jgi:hypothetical protein
MVRSSYPMQGNNLPLILESKIREFFMQLKNLLEAHNKQDNGLS